MQGRTIQQESEVNRVDDSAAVKATSVEPVEGKPLTHPATSIAIARPGYIPFSLDAVNFLMSDVRGALGPFLVIFLVTQQNWTQSSVGFVTMVAGLIGLLCQTPIGAAIDKTRAKRGILVFAVAVLGVSALTIYKFHSFYPVFISLVAMAIVGDVFAPAVAALTLGLYPRKTLARRMGRNAAYEHAGNVFIAIAAGYIGYYYTQRAVFLLVPSFALMTALAILSIPAAAVDHERASGMEKEKRSDDIDNSFKTILKSKAILILAISTMLFHFANAPLLILVGQKLAHANPKAATAMMSACIVAAQMVMLPIALFVGQKADQWGRKPIFLIAFLVLPLRAILYTLSNDTNWLIGVQLLDGVGAGILGALLPLIIADATRGTTHYNFTQGAVMTAQGVGASLSCLTAGLLVDNLGYDAAFYASAFSALVALAVFALYMPETKVREV